MNQFPIILSCLLFSSAALGAEPAHSVREAGNFGIGIGGGTAVSGLSMKYFVSDDFALQGVIGGAGYGHHSYGHGGHSHDHDKYGHGALGVNFDLLWEMPPLATVDNAFELGLALGFGGWAWVGDPAWLGAAGVAGLEFNLIPVPVDIVVEYRPSLRLVPEVGFEPIDFGGHIRVYFN